MTSTEQLSFITETLDLDTEAAAGLFGVSAARAEAWQAGDISDTDKVRIHTVWELVGLLELKLRDGRLPAVMTRRAAAFGGSTYAEAIAAGRDS